MTIAVKQLMTALYTHRQARSDAVTTCVNLPIQADYPDVAPPADYRAELAAAKARIVAAADEARRSIERDLHDGLQQRLVSLALEARQAGASVPAGQQELKSGLARIADGLAEALDNIREIARGIHPAVLSQSGLGPAVKALARRSPVPVRLHLAVEGRLAGPVEAGAYYIICEALTNVAKHARASVVEVAIAQGAHSLDLSVDDDGVGGATQTGPGLTGLSDRVDALAGTMQLVSPPGCGTYLRVILPIGPCPAQIAGQCADAVARAVQQRPGRGGGIRPPRDEPAPTGNRSQKRASPMPEDRVLPGMILAQSAVTAVIGAPIEAIDIAGWLRSLPDKEYQRCAPPDHKAAGYTTTDDGRPMSVNVEMIGGRLIVQHYVYEVAGRQHCHMVSLSDVLTPQGWTTTQVIWDLSVTGNGDGTCAYTNSVTSHPTTGFLAFIDKNGISFSDAAAASQAATDDHNHRETPRYAASIGRRALAHR